MKLILRRGPDQSITDVKEYLRGSGFNLIMMASDAYNRRWIQELTEDQVEDMGDTPLGFDSTYYKRLMSIGRARCSIGGAPG